MNTKLATWFGGALFVLLSVTPEFALAGGPTTTVSFDFENFTEVSVFSVFGVTVNQGPEFSVQVTIDAEAMNDLDVTLTGSRLNLGLLPGDHNIQTIDAQVTMPVLNDIDLEGVVNVIVAGFDQNQMSIDIEGVSRLRGESLSLDNLTADVSGVSELNLADVFPIGSATVSVSGTSQATLNMDVGSSLSGSVMGTSTLSYYGTNVNVTVTTEPVSQLVRLGDTQSDGAGLRINTGLSGGWFNSATPGQGFMIEVLPDDSEIFLAWFTYAATQSGVKDVGEPDHRWLTAQGAFEGDTATLDVVLTSGGIFDDPAPVTNTAEGSYGSLTLTFEDCTSGQLAYDLTSPGLNGTIPITRISDDNVSLCTQLAGFGKSGARYPARAR